MPWIYTADEEADPQDQGRIQHESNPGQWTVVLMVKDANDEANLAEWLDLIAPDGVIVSPDTTAGVQINIALQHQAMWAQHARDEIERQQRAAEWEVKKDYIPFSEYIESTPVTRGEMTQAAWDRLQEIGRDYYHRTGGRDR